MTSRQIEIKKLAGGVGLTAEYNEKTKMLAIKKDETLLGEINEQGFIYEDPNQEWSNELDKAYESMLDIVDQAKFYIAVYENAEPLPFDNLKDYRKLSEFGGTYLGIRDCGEQGFEFLVCAIKEYGNDADIKTTADNIIKAGQDFSTYSGLVDSCRIVNAKESAAIYRSADFVLTHAENLTDEEAEELMNLEYKLCYAYPEINDNTPAFKLAESTTPNLDLQ